MPTAVWSLCPLVHPVVPSSSWRLTFSHFSNLWNTASIRFAPRTIHCCHTPPCSSHLFAMHRHLFFLLLQAIPGVPSSASAILILLILSDSCRKRSSANDFLHDLPHLFLSCSISPLQVLSFVLGNEVMPLFPWFIEVSFGSRSHVVSQLLSFPLPRLMSRNTLTGTFPTACRDVVASSIMFDSEQNLQIHSFPPSIDMASTLSLPFLSRNLSRAAQVKDSRLDRDTT